MRTTVLATMSFVMLLGLTLAHAESKAPEKIKLGRQKIGNYTVSVILVGDPHDQKTVEFDVKLYDQEASKTPPPDPKALRAWIGSENAKTEEKIALSKKKTTFGGTVPVPQPLAESAKVWIEVETDSGVAKGSFKLDEHDHKH
jgi:hypothetical protein